jgi:hypothetical protein
MSYFSSFLFWINFTLQPTIKAHACPPLFAIALQGLLYRVSAYLL